MSSPVNPVPMLHFEILNCDMLGDSRKDLEKNTAIDYCFDSETRLSRGMVMVIWVIEKRPQHGEGQKKDPYFSGLPLQAE